MSVIFTFGSIATEPSTTPNTYSVSSNTPIRSWFVGNAGDILSLTAGSSLYNYLWAGGVQTPVTVYKDLVERDAAIQTGDIRGIVLNDSSVSTFSGLYHYTHSTTTWIKVDETDGLNPDMLESLSSKLRIERVAELPLGVTARKNTIYMAKEGVDELVLGFTGSTHNYNTDVLYKVISTTALINYIVESDINSILVYADISARDSDTLVGNKLAIVLDASADATVTSGAATYVYRHSDTSWTKISEQEGLDVVVNWVNLNDKPSSAVGLIDAATSNRHVHTELLADIDDAAIKRHEHLNKSVLDDMSNTEGVLEYKGSPVNEGVVDDSW